MIIHNCLQNSEEWQAIRRGRPSASRFKDIITAAKGELSKSCTDYMHELIGECFVPDWVEFAGNKFTDRGTELEPEARMHYAAMTGVEVTQVGFVTRKDEVVGASPDGLIAKPGIDVEADAVYDAAGRIINGLDLFRHGVEIKCLSPKKHVSCIAAGVLPDDFRQQVHGSMAVTGLNSWDFFSYFPGLAPFLITVRRDDYTEKLSASLDAFLIEYAKVRTAVIPKLQLTKIKPEELA